MKVEIHCFRARNYLISIFLGNVTLSFFSLKYEISVFLGNVKLPFWQASCVNESYGTCVYNINMSCVFHVKYLYKCLHNYIMNGSLESET